MWTATRQLGRGLRPLRPSWKAPATAATARASMWRSPALAHAAPFSSSNEAQAFPLPVKFESHLCDGPQVEHSESTKEELLEFHRLMYTIRRMEITCDTEYKARNIRGFCHLYDGQEAIAAGLQSALAKEDDVISAYRCHGLQYVRGDQPSRIFGELFGKYNGTSKGKGGSMHLYSKKNHFWGGAGIVGAQVPVGAGLAFANKYRAKGKWPANIAVTMYGDGAANQGQVWEAANMAKLWNLPAIFLIENNQYGMGTSIDRSSCNPDYYKQGGVAIPGVRCDGMDVLAVRECMKWAKEWAGNGNGPLFIEAKTYRYHGHSMSDPGITYRGRDEVQDMRQNRDCIELVKKHLIDAGWSTEQEIKSIEKDIRKFVSDELNTAKEWDLPKEEYMYKDIFYQEEPDFIRGVEYSTSRVLKD